MSSETEKYKLIINWKGYEVYYEERIVAGQESFSGRKPLTESTLRKEIDKNFENALKAMSFHKLSVKKYKEKELEKNNETQQ